MGGGDLLDFIKKKFKVQIIPTVIFLTFFCYLFSLNFISAISESSKHGYWFTISLFEYFILFGIIKLCPVKVQTPALFATSFCLCLTKGFELNNTLCNILGLYHCWYFVFFVFGVFTKNNFQKFQSIIDSNVLSFVIALFTIWTFMRIKESFIILLPFQILQVVVLGCLGITIVFAFFRKYQKGFTSDKLLGATLQYIGTRTLDIYLIHYLFIPQNLHMVGKFFEANHNPTLEFILSFALSIVIVGLCLIISNLFRTSSFLSKLLFGVKK